MHYSHYAGCGPAMKRERSRYAYWGGGHLRRPKYNVPLNTLERDTHYEVHVYASGFAKENIKLTVVDDVLFISGTRAVDENNLPNFITQEFPIRSFERMISLRGQVDTATITARQEDGILIVTLPKTKEAQKPVQEIKVM
jgi:HSP20 family protein